MVKVVKKISTESFKPSVVFDLDSLGKDQFPDLDSEDLTPIREREVGNNDAEVIKSRLQGSRQLSLSKNDPTTPLTFESRFESGNLRRAIQVSRKTKTLLEINEKV